MNTRVLILAAIFCGVVTACYGQASHSKPPVTALAISADGLSVVTGSQAGAEIYSWPDLSPKGKIATELAQVNDLCFAPDGKQLLVVGGAAGESGDAEFWTWPEGKRVAKARPHEDLIYRARWSKRGDMILTAGADGAVKVLDSSTLETKVTYSGHSRAVSSTAWTPGEGLAVSASGDQTLQIWEVASGRRIRALSNHVGAVNDLAFRPHEGEGPLILASISEDRTVRLWQPSNGRLIRFAKLPSVPRVVLWAPSGETLWVGCNDGIVRVLGFEDLAVQREIAGEVGRIYELAQHPSEDVLVVGGERGIRALKVEPTK